MLNSPGKVTDGTTFQVPVVLTGGTDVSSVPLQIQYDPSKLTLVNVGDGDLLNRDGQIVSMAHRDDGGSLTVNVSRPPGAPGVSGAGVVCVLTFQASSQGAERPEHYASGCDDQHRRAVAGTNLTNHDRCAVGALKE